MWIDAENHDSRVRTHASTAVNRDDGKAFLAHEFRNVARRRLLTELHETSSFKDASTAPQTTSVRHGDISNIFWNCRRTCMLLNMRTA